jgi:hypothetical protein
MSSFDMRDAFHDFSESLFVNYVFCTLTWTGSVWELFIQGPGTSTLTSTTNDPAAAQVESDTALWTNGNKRFTIWKLTDVDQWQAYAV